MIYFHSETDFILKEQPKFASWIAACITSFDKEVGELNYIFLNDERLLKMNQEYLGHDTLTDIITFDYCENEYISGDIFISVERVEQNAEKFEVLFEEELKRVMIHGVLHLLGFNDKTAKEKEKMRDLENRCIQKQ